MSAAGHAKMGCCEHGDGGSGQTAPCKPGMACSAMAVAIPAAGVNLAIPAFDNIDPVQAPTRALASLPPDRDIRPPIVL